MLTVPAPEALLLHHAYGTNGIVLEVELALAPVHQWIERLDVFDDFADALNYANACVRSPGLVKRQVALRPRRLPIILATSTIVIAPGSMRLSA